MKLFISYRSLDSAKVDTLVTRLKSLKNADNTLLYTVWQDKTGIPDGHDWWEVIVDAIIDCDIFIYMLSRASANNVNCRAELSYAYKRNRPILPLVLENEFAFNPISGKNDIDYWKDVPDELNDIRAQFLFYEGTSFVNRIQESIAYFQREPQRWRDMPADRPPDPRHVSEDTNNTAVLYDEACDYAWRLEISTAERLFQKLVRMNDPDFGEDAHEWILLLREYQKLLTFDARDSTRHKVSTNWSSYKQKFPKPFIELFDPIDFNARYSSAIPNRPQASTEITSPPSQPHRLNLFDILPEPFDLIEIPKGDVTVDGITETIETFQIAKYPVTNAQFVKFIQSNGYHQKAWWTEAGWEEKDQARWIKPRYFQDLKWTHSLQPVVGISWYEAVAFCLWLSAETGNNIMLPTQHQWQRAAQGDDGRIYPWGNEWDASRCNNNTEGKGIGGTTSVTLYEGKNKGDSYFGVVDMVGNVWEWCQTAYATGNQDLNARGTRVFRGGSWEHRDSKFFQCNFSGDANSDFRHKTIGFRVAISY